MEGFGDLKKLMEQAGKMQSSLKQIQEEMKDRIVEGSAGGGMVTAKVNGRQELLELKIDPEVVDPGDVELLEDLIKAAIGQAMKKSREMLEEEVGRLAGGLPIQGLFS
ncbi:MAG: YbaB/EbfC family nucleoid-associated protein [Phycisphaerae bacterium]|nr:YbaB/EbfC family nucleoid-associated protein [Phycisphaerae bacterium]